MRIHSGIKHFNSPLDWGNQKTKTLLKKFSALAIYLVCATIMLSGCSSTNRLSPDSLSENENGAFLTSQDFRTISQRLARSLITLPQIQRAINPPKIAFISVENKSNEYVDGEAFLNKIRTDLIKNSGGKIIFLDRKNLIAIRNEIAKKETDEFTSRKTQTQTIPLGADFFLTGTIESIDNISGKHSTRYVRYSFRLTDATSSAIIWEDDYEIKKVKSKGIVYSN